MLILCGMTAAGKDSTLKELVKSGMNPIISYTTRDKRPSETEGIEYYFITSEEFDKKELDGFFAETTEYNTVDGIKKYGIAIKDLTDDKVVILNPDGIRQIKKIEGINPIIFLIECDEKIIRKRLKKRGDKKEEVDRRLEADREDFKDIEKYINFSIHNNDELSPAELADMIYRVYERR